MLDQHYGIHNAVLTPMAKGVVNRNYLVETPAGRYVLKQFTPLYRREEALRSCTVQAELREAGIPVPEIIRNRQGELLTETPDGRFMLSEFVAGRQYERAQIPPAAARSMGQTLGQMHRVLAGMEHAAPYQPPHPEAVVRRLQELLARAEAKRTESAVDEAACLILLEKIRTLSEWGQSPAAQPAQLVHGDYQETNVIFTEDHQVAAVIDFDNLRNRPRSVEVMRAFAFSFDAGNGPAEEAYDFASGYIEASGVQADEVAQWAPDWTYYNLSRDWPISSRYLEPETYDPRWDRFITYRPNWWVKNHAAVTERLLATITAV